MVLLKAIENVWKAFALRRNSSAMADRIVLKVDPGRLVDSEELGIVCRVHP